MIDETEFISAASLREISINAKAPETILKEYLPKMLRYVKSAAEVGSRKQGFYSNDYYSFFDNDFIKADGKTFVVEYFTKLGYTVAWNCYSDLECLELEW